MSGAALSGQANETPTVLDKLSAHLVTLGAQIQSVEHAVSEKLYIEVAPQSGAITQLQSLDYLRQSLEDLALLTRLLARAEIVGSIPPKVAADISAKLNLNDTKALICSETYSEGFGADIDGSGDVDLF